MIRMVSDPKQRIDRIPPAEYRAWREGFRMGRGVHRGTLLALLMAIVLLLLIWATCAT